MLKVIRVKNYSFLGHFLLWGLLVLIAFACKRHSIPKDIIPERVMQDMLFEIYVANGIAENDTRDLELRRMQRDMIHQGIIENYGYTRDDFFKSYEYYLLHPVYLDSIHRRMSLQIDKMMMNLEDGFRKNEERMDEAKRAKAENASRATGTKP